ncbi:MAG: hypothetical protein EBZ77_15615 [Chitinophagia bacterium]|nr:hypothetical protein [Chitinophagia bacterium]
MPFTASAAGRFGTTAGNAPRLCNKAAAAASRFGNGADPCIDSAGSATADRQMTASGILLPAAGGCRSSVSSQYPPPPPPPGCRVGAVVTSTTRLVLRRQRRAGSQRRPAAAAQVNCDSIG